MNNIDVLISARERIDNKAGALQYEGIKEFCGGADGLFDPTRSDDECDDSPWSLTTNQSVRILAGFPNGAKALKNTAASAVD